VDYVDFSMLALVGAFFVVNISSFLFGALWGKESVYKAIRKYRSYPKDL